jgi:alkylated DNA repair dioxygenase AlkB
MVPAADPRGSDRSHGLTVALGARSRYNEQVFVNDDRAHPPDLSWQSTLFGTADPGIDPAVEVGRLDLDADSWVDRATGWLAGADALFAELHRSIVWHCPEVTMYDRRLRQPRLSAWFRFDGESLPAEPLLRELGAALSSRYGEDFDSVGFNLYRDGDDSVAWHGDRHAKVLTDPVVAIVTLGSARPFLLRPGGGGRSVRLLPHPGDLLVMGGACQHRWEHCVPKVRRAGPRLSITFRHGATNPGVEASDVGREVTRSGAGV